MRASVEPSTMSLRSNTQLKSRWPGASTRSMTRRPFTVTRRAVTASTLTSCRPFSTSRTARDFWSRTSGRVAEA